MVLHLAARVSASSLGVAYLFGVELVPVTALVPIIELVPMRAFVPMAGGLFSISLVAGRAPDTAFVVAGALDELFPHPAAMTRTAANRSRNDWFVFMSRVFMFPCFDKP